MVFKRREKRSYLSAIREFVYPRAAFGRAVTYMWHRMRRLPDEPHRIARGVFAGVLVSFTPFFGLHFLFAGLIAYLMRGNILALCLATFVGNPITFPFIAIVSLETGHWLLGIHAPLDFLSIVAAFSSAGTEIWHNIRALFTDDVAHWENLRTFFRVIFFPYFVGGLLPGMAVSFGFYFATLPTLHAYQKLRKNRLRDRVEKRRQLKAAVQEADARKAAKQRDDAAAGNS